MPRFDADSIVEPLEYTFAYKAGETAVPGPSGVIPEPSDQQIGEFLAGLKQVMAGAREKLGLKEDIDITNAAQLAQALDDLEPEEFVRAADEVAGLYADLCSGTPSKAQILTLPTRRRNLFYEWLQGEAISPEAAAPAGSGQLNHRALRAAG